MIDTYPGGKNGAGVYQNLINQIPPHKFYIEGFLGSGAIMRRKKSAAFNVGIDRDLNVVLEWIKAYRPPQYDFLLGRFLGFLDRIDEFGYAACDTFIYLDPPYLAETRRDPRPLYRYEMLETEQHIELLAQIQHRAEMIMISGYWSDLYAEYLAGWRVENFETVDRGGNTRTEFLWMNYPKPVRLHDYSYLGRDFIDRQRIKRKIRRLVKKLDKLPPLERAALIAALTEYE